MANELQRVLLSVANVLVASFAVATLARLVTRERGPYALFAKWRRLTIKLIGYGRWGREVYEVLSCPVCLSVWLSLIGAIFSRDIMVFLGSPILAWIWIAASMTPELPNDAE